LLLSNPPLAYALLQASVLLGLISTQVAQQMQIMQNPMMALSQMGGMGVGGVGVGGVGVGGVGGVGVGAGVGGVPFGYGTNINPYQAVGFPMAPMQSQPQPSISTEQLEDVLPEDQKVLLTQVMKLTVDQIEKLPPHEQAQILQLRSTMLSLGYKL